LHNIIIYHLKSPKDDIVLQAMVPWQLEMKPIAERTVGQSRVNLQQSQCSSGECNLGNFFTDAMLHAVSSGGFNPLATDLVQ